MSVMNKIHNGEVQMRPRLYYTVLGLTSVSAILLSSMVAAYMFSIIIFWLRIQTANTMAYGARANLANSVESFPVWTALVSVILIILATTLSRRYRRIYKYKVSTVAAFLIISSLIIGLILSFSGINKPHSSASDLAPKQHQTL